MKISQFSSVKNIVFDMDGTLVNTALVTVSACQQAADLFGMAQKLPGDITKLIGFSDLEFHSRLYPGYSIDILEKYAVEVEKRENELMLEMGCDILFDGVQELLETLKQKGFYLSIASTGSTSHVNVALNASGICPYFKDIRCNSSKKTDMVKELMQNGRKEEWVIIGDKNSDYTAGRNNNITTVAARYGFGSEAEYEQFDYGIDYPLQLLPLLLDE